MKTSESLYLRRNIQAEPLVDHWYAWPFLIPPATAARNLTERHLKIMDSYIAAPKVHASAVKNPKMRGGPFVDLNGERADEIRSLRDQIKVRRRDLIDLSAALLSLDILLRERAKGQGLEALYPLVPEALRGYVELIYDLNNQPSFRLVEPLLYKSKYYDRSQQSLLLSVISNDDRPFILSTPRLPSQDTLHLSVSFDTAVIDDLFRLKSVPQSWSIISSKLQLENSLATLARSFFTAEAPPPYKHYDGSGIRWRYFGHACILIETREISVLVDPVLSYTYESHICRYTYEDLPDRIDFVLITHNHQDHILFETLLQIRYKVGAVVVPRNGSGHLQDPSLRLLLESCGFTNVIELNEFQDLRRGDLTITGLPFFGEHADLDVRTKMAWLVRIGDTKLLFAADSCNIEPRLYRHIHREIGDVTVLFLGMECDGAPLSWLYGPLLTHRIDRRFDESRRLAGSNYEQAVNLVEQFHCEEVYVYAMGQEPWLNYIMSLKYTDESRPIIHSTKLLEWCRLKGMTAERLFGEKELIIV